MVSFTVDTQPSVETAVWQLEAGEVEGTLHYQGYLVFGRSVRMNAVKRALGQDGPQAHLEICHGSPEQNIAYCTKESTRRAGPFWYPDETTVRGRKQGMRTDLKALASAVSTGTRLSDLAPVDIAKYSKQLESVRKHKVPPPMRSSMRVTCICGPSGIGKTTWVMDNLAPYKLRIFDKCYWADGYDGEHTVLIDDYKGQLPIHEFNALCDRFPLRVPVKGSFVNAEWTHVVICTNVSPSEWYNVINNSPEEIDSVMRRIGHGVWVGKDLDRRTFTCKTREELLLCVTDSGVPTRLSSTQAVGGTTESAATSAAGAAAGAAATAGSADFADAVQVDAIAKPAQDEVAACQAAVLAAAAEFRKMRVEKPRDSKYVWVDESDGPPRKKKARRGAAFFVDSEAEEASDQDEDQQQDPDVDESDC